MSEPFLSQITMFAGNFAPRGWAFCDGQLLSISQNSALFALLGTAYGGDGRTTFGLPDLRGRVPMHAGTGPGLSPRQWGQKGGTETNTLTELQLPPHTHPLQGSSNEATTDVPAGAVLANSRTNTYAASGTDATLASSSIGLTGGGQPVNNIQPFQTVNFIIALQGIFPSRN